AGQPEHNLSPSLTPRRRKTRHAAAIFFRQSSRQGAGRPAGRQCGPRGRCPVPASGCWDRIPLLCSGRTGSEYVCAPRAGASPHPASTRVGPPDAPVTFGAPTNTVAPAGGNFDRLATHSRPHLPAPSQSLWTANSSAAPKSSDRVSTASPATSRSLSSHSHASFEKPAKCSVFEPSWPRNAPASPAFASQPEFRNTPQFLGSRPCVFSHAFRSSRVTTASAFLPAFSRRSITAAGTISEDGSRCSAVPPLGAKWAGASRWVPLCSTSSHLLA